MSRDHHDPNRIKRLLFDPRFAELVIRAASALGRRPKGGNASRQRRYTGIVEGRRRPRGQRVKLPNGQVATLLGALRGRAVVCWDDPETIEGSQLAIVPATNLRVLKHPAAVILGRLKTGVHERPSLRKQRSARRNGRMPCRAGKRRGRTPKVRDH